MSFWTTLFKDHGVTDVLDMTPGSCAAATGAYYAGVNYDGICLNQSHRRWCDAIMDRCMFAVVADGGNDAEDEFIKKVAHFFRPQVEEGMRMLRDLSPPDEQAQDARGDASDEDDEGS